MLNILFQILGNGFVLAVFFYLAIIGSLKLSIFFSFFIGLAYLFLTLSSKNRFHLCAGLLLISLGYSLAVRLIPDVSFWLMLSFPLLFALYIKSLYSRKEFAQSFEIIGHLNFLYLIIVTIVIQRTLSSGVVFISMLVYTILYLFFARVKKDSNFIFGGAIAFSLSYYFLLRLMPEPVSTRAILFYSMISIIYIAIGSVISKRIPRVSNVLYTAAILISIGTSIFVLFLPEILGGTIIILISAVSFTLMMLLTKKSEYLYLTSLSLGFLIFHFLQISKGVFSKELVDYFFYALLVLGSIFIFLFLKERLKLRMPFSFFIVRGTKGTLLFLSPIILILIIVFILWYPLRVTMNPIFCGSCHNMKAAYATWENSAHSEVECGKCHYIPGLVGFIRTKMEGMAETVSYISGNYSEKNLHHPMVDETNCTSCHKLKKLFDMDITYKAELPFDHEFHLSEKPLGIELTCTSCHSQISIDTHFSINESTCLTCHTLDIENFELKEVKVREQICDACHARGMVKVTEEIHNIHVKGQKARCIACHKP